MKKNKTIRYILALFASLFFFGSILLFITPDIYISIGFGFSKLNKPDLAKKFYTIALSFDQNCSEAKLNLGVLYQNNKQYDLAEKCYKSILIKNPQYLEAKNNLGLVYYYKGEYSLAEKELLQALNSKQNLKKPINQLYNNLGLVYLKQKNFDKAISCFKLYFIKSKDPMVYYNLAKTYKEIGNYDLAIENYNKILEYVPFNSSIKKKIKELEKLKLKKAIQVYNDESLTTQKVNF